MGAALAGVLDDGGAYHDGGGVFVNLIYFKHLVFAAMGVEAGPKRGYVFEIFNEKRFIPCFYCRFDSHKPTSLVYSGISRVAPARAKINSS
jgi:hypothetical protein